MYERNETIFKGEHNDKIIARFARGCRDRARGGLMAWQGNGDPDCKENVLNCCGEILIKNVSLHGYNPLLM